MTIVVHPVADCIEPYRQRSWHWSPSECPACGGCLLWPHDRYAHGGEPGDADPVRIQRFPCGGRGYAVRVTILPDLLLPRCSYPAEVCERAVAAYVNGQGTYEQVAAAVGVAKIEANGSRPRTRSAPQ